ncbi:hypothetical protein [Caenispirillum bisanense]|uniref:hypothetical protein n=1 Tax=Caenispirillum bisanense TaxID=414052 RepID=UPI0031D00CA6
MADTRTDGRAAPWLRRAAALVVLLVALPLAAGCSPVRVVEAASLLLDLSDPPAPGRDLDGVARQEIAGPGGRPADLYRVEAPRAALLVVPGAAEAGRRDVRLVAFAADLARAGFLVMVPQLAGSDPLRVSAADADAVAEAVTVLADTAGVPAVGVVGVSYAVDPALLAALRPEVSERVAFALVIGGYHDITAAVTYMTTGLYRAAGDAAWRSGPVEQSARWLFLRANADRVGGDGPDTSTLAAIAARRLRDPAAPVDDLVSMLGPPGMAVWRLLVNDEPEAVPALLADLPPALRDEVTALDLAGRDLTALRARLVLIHGRDDPMVPFTESQALAARLPPDQARLYVVDGLNHVEVGDLGLGDMATLLRAAYRLLAERDAAPRPIRPAG